MALRISSPSRSVSSPSLSASDTMVISSPSVMESGSACTWNSRPTSLDHSPNSQVKGVSRVMNTCSRGAQAVATFSGISRARLRGTDLAKKQDQHRQDQSRHQSAPQRAQRMDQEQHPQRGCRQVGDGIPHQDGGEHLISLPGQSQHPGRCRVPLLCPAFEADLVEGGKGGLCRREKAAERHQQDQGRQGYHTAIVHKDSINSTFCIGLRNKKCAFRRRLSATESTFFFYHSILGSGMQGDGDALLRFYPRVKALPFQSTVRVSPSA